MSTVPRRRLSAEERRDQLVSAATSVLAEAGYRGATADAIVQRAGVSKGLLWHHFRDLDDLLELTARTGVMRIARSVGEGLDLDAPVPDIVRAAIHAASRIPATHATEYRALQQVVPNLRGPDGAPRLSQDDYAELHAAQEALFRRGQAEGDVRAELDPRVLAITYQSAVDAMITYLESHADADADGYADALADILLAGIAGSGDPAPSSH